MMRAMTQWQERSALEEYIYNHLELRPVDFLHRNFAVERQVEEIGNLELALASGTPEEVEKLLGDLEGYPTCKEFLSRPMKILESDAHPSGVVIPNSRQNQLLTRSALRLNIVLGTIDGLGDKPVKFLSQRIRESVLGGRFSKRTLQPAMPANEAPVLSFGARNTRCSFLSGYHGESRVTVPICYTEYGNVVTVFPFPDAAPLYNYRRMIDDEWLPTVNEENNTIVLTDSLEIAWRNDLSCVRNGLQGVLWSSWHGGAQRIGDVDWSPLKGRRVYYVVLDHSGYTADGACQVALRVGEAIRTELGMELTYLICLERATAVGGLRRLPVALNAAEFADFANRSNAECSVRSSILRQVTSRLSTAGFQGKRARVFHPFIHERTITLLYGREAVGKSWLAIGIAACAARGKALFGSWQAERPTDVVYICPDAANSPVVEKFEAILGEHDWNQVVKTSAGSFRIVYPDRGNRNSTTLSVLCIPDDALGPETRGILLWQQFAGEYTQSPTTPGRLVILDGFSSLALSASLGIGVIFSVLPLFIYQGGLTLFASSLQQFFTNTLINELSAVGGLLLIGLGINILEIKKLSVLNMLPSLVIAVILAYFFL